MLLTEDDVRAVARSRYEKIHGIKDKSMRLFAFVVISVIGSALLGIPPLIMIVPATVVFWWIRRVVNGYQAAEESLLKIWNDMDEVPEQIGADN